MLHDHHYQRSNWVNLAKALTDDELGRTLNHHWSRKDQCYFKTTEIPRAFLDEIKVHNKVLDFGVGLGRNQIYLESIFDKVHGFDLPEMLARNKTTPRKNLYSRLDALHHDYDLIYEVTTLQHMPPSEVIYALQTLAPRARYLFSHTRTYNDFHQGVDMYHLIMSSGKWDSVLDTSKNPTINSLSEEHLNFLFKSKVCK